MDVNNVSINDLTPSLIENKINIYRDNVIKFNEIWGTILNSSNKLSNDTKEEVVDTFRKIIGNIEKVNTPSEQSGQPRGRRNQPAIEINYFDDNAQFNNDTIKGFISDLKPKILKNQKMFKPLMDYYAMIITRNSNEEDYQQLITNFLKILEMSIRKTIIENPNGIFKELPSINDIINNQEDVKEDPEQEDFRKKLKTPLNKLILYQSASILKAEKLEEERKKLREQSMSLDTKTEKSIQSKMNTTSAINDTTTTSAINDTNITPSHGTETGFQNEIKVGGPFSPVVATQRDFVETPPISPSSEAMKLENQRMQEQSSVASSTTTIPSQGPVSSSKRKQQTIQVRSTRGSILRLESATKKLKTPTKGGYHKFTLKKIKNKNKYKYSIKNRPQLKNKSIKHNKRKHNKTYKR